MDAVEELVETFEFFDDWEDRYRHIIDLGKALPGLPEAAKTDANKVKGCQSQVWMTADIADGSPPVMTFAADSDAHIVRGLISILLSIYSGQPADAVAAVDSREIFERLGLDRHLSPSRANGLVAMDKRIKDLAAHALAGAAS